MVLSFSPFHFEASQLFSFAAGFCLSLLSLTKLLFKSQTEPPLVHLLLAAGLNVQSDSLSLSLVIVFHFPSKLHHFLLVVVAVAGLVVSLFPPII